MGSRFLPNLLRNEVYVDFLQDGNDNSSLR